MKIDEIFTPRTLPNALYHATTDKHAIDILQQGVLYASEDAWGKTEEPFVSTTIDPKLKFHAGTPDTANVQFVLNKSYLVKAGYKFEMWDDWDEVRVILPNGELSINKNTVIHVVIEDNKTKYFKNWRHHRRINFDSPRGEKDYEKLKKNELNPKGEFVGNNNPFSIIEMLASRKNIPVKTR
jgi:hypothetical protein